MKEIESLGNDDHRIYLGDSMEVLKHRIQDNSIDLIFADPPYNIGKIYGGIKEKLEEDTYIEWCKEWLTLCLRKLTPTGSLYFMTATQYMPFIDMFLRDKIEILSRIIWYYDSSGVQAKNYFGSMYEPILFAVKDKKNYTFNADDILVEAKTGAKRKLIDYRKNPPQPYNNEKIPGNVWEYARVRYRMDEYENHPTQKPIELLKRIIKASSNEGNTILDPFSGTFTTSYVAKMLGRKSISIELQEEYVKIGLRRLELAFEYKGEILCKESRSFEIKNNGAIPESSPTLFNL